MNEDFRDEQLSRLYREADRIEPPRALDAAILAAAREAVKPAPPRRAWWQAWTLPMGVAATVVLTVTLTLMVQQEQERPMSEAPPTQGAPATAPQEKPDAAADLAGKPAAPREAKQEAVKREAEGPAVDPAPAPETAAPAGAVASRAPMAESAKSVAPARPAAVMRQQAAPAADAVESRAKSAPLRKEAVGAAPAQWLEDIREMKKQGKEKEAAEALAEFRKAYPDYRLPEDLRQ